MNLERWISVKCLCPIADIEIFSFAFQPIDSRMYVVVGADSSAVVIDPSESYDAVMLFRQHGISDISVILTHEHYDHISGVNYLREHFNCNIIASEKCAEALPEPRKNLSYYFESLFCTHSDEVIQQVRDLKIKPYSCNADTVFADEYTLLYCGHQFHLRYTPGHSIGSTCILLDDKCLFSGDSLLHTPVVTRLPSSSKRDYCESALPYISKLNRDVIVYPGHGDADSIMKMQMTEV